MEYSDIYYYRNVYAISFAQSTIRTIIFEILWGLRTKNLSAKYWLSRCTEFWYRIYFVRWFLVAHSFTLTYSFFTVLFNFWTVKMYIVSISRFMHSVVQYYYVIWRSKKKKKTWNRIDWELRTEGCDRTLCVFNVQYNVYFAPEDKMGTICQNR